ncbi:MAG: putative Ig domain-containing protein, partial [Candidatus Limnocylindrales bacterium]
PYTWTLAAGSLPPGLTINSAGLISGTPTLAGTWTGLVFQVKDSGGGSALSGSLSITIDPSFFVAVPIAPPSLAGLVTDACTGLPITRGVIIGLQSTAAVGLPGSVIRPSGSTIFGFFAYPILAGGSYQLSIQAPGYAPLGAAPGATSQPGLPLTLDESRTALPDGGALAEGLLLDLRLAPLNPPATGCRAALPPFFPTLAGRIVSNAGRGVANLSVELQTVNPATGRAAPGTDALGQTNRLGLFSLTVANLGAFDEGQHQVVVYRAGRSDALTVKLGDQAGLSAPSGYESLVVGLRLPADHPGLAAGPGSSSADGAVTSSIDVATTPASAQLIGLDVSGMPTEVTPRPRGPRGPLSRRRAG